MPKKPKKPTKSWRATEWLRTNGGTLLDAAKRFRVTRQAVQQMWNARGLGELPTQQKHAQIIERLSRCDGMTTREIAEQTGFHVSTVWRLAKEAGVSVAPAPTIIDRIRPDVEDLLPRIRSREITVTEASHCLGVTSQILYEAMKTLIDQPLNLSNRGRDFRQVVDGKSKSARASDLVDAGETITDASAKIGVSPRCVYKYRENNGLPVPGRRAR